MHLCRGNYKSTFMGSGGYEAVQEILFNRINVHGYFMEYDTERAGGFEPLRAVPKGKTVVLGLVTTKSGTLESKDALKRRIDEAAKFVDIDQLCLSPQCGFASTEEGNILAEDEQWAKLRMIVSRSVADGRVLGQSRMARRHRFAERSPSSPARRAASGAASRSAWRRRAPRSSPATSARACRAPAPTPARRSSRRRDQEGRRRGDRLDAVDRRAEERRGDRQDRGRDLRPRRHPGQQCRHPARRDLPPHEPQGLAGRARRPPQRLVQHEPRLRRAFPRAEFRRLRAHDLDLGAGRQFRPGQLHGGEVRHRRACRARSRSTCSASRCARTASRRSPGPA